jgi:hypothetical protein
MKHSRRFGNRPYYKLPKNQAAAAATAWNLPDLCAAYQWPSGEAGGGVIAIV